MEKQYTAVMKSENEAPVVPAKPKDAAPFEGTLGLENIAPVLLAVDAVALFL